MDSLLLARSLLHFHSQILLFTMYQNYSFGRNSNLVKPPSAEFKFLETQT